jgi:hypothetical protein
MSAVTPLDVRRMHVEAKAWAPRERGGRTVQAHPTAHHVRKLIRSGLSVAEIAREANVPRGTVDALVNAEKVRLPKAYAERIRGVRPKQVAS